VSVSHDALFIEMNKVFYLLSVSMDQQSKYVLTQMSKGDRARCKGVDCDTWVIEGMDGGLRRDRPGYCSVCSRALDMLEKMADNKRKRPAGEDEDDKENPEKKSKTSKKWEPFFTSNNTITRSLINNEALFEIREALPWRKPDVFAYPCGLKFYHGPCTLCGIAMEQRKKDEAEKKKKKDEEEAKDRLEGQRPCQGGRYREYPNGDVIIQCNCNFFCTSAIDDKTRERKVQPKLPEGQHYPYYYNCPEKDKIPGWTPWQRAEELETEEDKKKRAAADKARMVDRAGTKTGSETAATPKPQSDLLGLPCTLIILLVVLAQSPLMVHATITEGPMPQYLPAWERVQTVTLECQELDFGQCDNPDKRVLTEFDFAAFEYTAAAFKERIEAWKAQVANYYDKCGLYDDEDDLDPLEPDVEKMPMDPVDPYIEQIIRDNQFRCWIMQLIHQAQLLNDSTEQVRLATEALIKANEDMTASITGSSKLPILFYCVCVFLPLLIRADIESDPDVKHTSFLILAVQICYCIVLFPRTQRNDVGYTTVAGVYICYPVVSCAFIVLYLALWLQAVIRGGCVPRATDVWS
jgi:hypothetical protein